MNGCSGVFISELNFIIIIIGLFFFLFVLNVYVRVSSYAHVRTLRPINGTCTSNLGRHDVQNVPQI